MSILVLYNQASRFITGVQTLTYMHKTLSEILLIYVLNAWIINFETWKNSAEFKGSSFRKFAPTENNVVLVALPTF